MAPPKGLENLTLYKQGFLIHPDPEIAKRIPIDYIIEQIIQIQKLEPAKRLIFLEANTGSGKTTVLPPELYLSLSARSIVKPHIGVVIPTKLTTMGVFNRILNTFPTIKTPKDITFNTGTIKLGGSPLTLMTRGIFLRTIQNVADGTNLDLIDRYNIVIIDEAHKKSLENDLIMSFIKTVIMRTDIAESRKPLFIFMSATLDTKELTKYFNIDDKDANKHIITVSGTTSDRTDIYISKAFTNVIEGAFAEVLNIVTNPKYNAGDMLIFMPTTRDINTLRVKLHNWVIEHKQPFLPISLTSSDINKFNENYTYKEMENARLERFGKRIIKIYIATNVAEEGVTLPRLMYVLDVGYTKVIEYNPHYMAECTIIKPISQAAADQRSGRTGRDCVGRAYRLYSKETFGMLSMQDIPEIYVNDFSMHYLTLLKSGIDLNGLMHPPPTELMMSIKDKLYFLGCIDSNEQLTDVGDLIRQISSTSVESARMMMAGYAYDVCVADLITIAAAIEFISPKTNTDIADHFIAAAIRLELYLFGLNYKSDRFIESPEYGVQTVRRKRDQFLNNDSVTDILDYRYKIVKNFAEAKLNIYNCPSRLAELRDIEIGNLELRHNPDLIDLLSKYKKCIYEGYKLNLVSKRSCNLDGYAKFSDIRGNNVIISDIYDPITNAVNNAIGLTKCEYPSYALAYKLEIKRGPNGNYEMYAGKISIMDGFVPVDPTFVTHYTYEIPNTITIASNKMLTYNALLLHGRPIYEMRLIDRANENVEYIIEREIENQEKIKNVTISINNLNDDIVTIPTY